MDQGTALMMRPAASSQRYAFVVAGVTFVALLTVAGVRSAPSVLIVPWEGAFGWDRSTVSAAAAVGILLYGLIGPFAAALMQRFGLRRTVIGALALMSLSIGAQLVHDRSRGSSLRPGACSRASARGCVAVGARRRPSSTAGSRPIAASSWAC